MAASGEEKRGAKQQQQPIVIYTDGACKGNPGPGGWAALIIMSGSEEEAVQVSGGCARSTNNIMEMKACIEGVRRALHLRRAQQSNEQIILYTDSAYVVKGMTEWMSGWKKKNWHTGMNKEVKNKELWLELEALDKEAGGVQWRWVRGHDGNPLNELVDRAASAQALKYAKGHAVL